MQLSTKISQTHLTPRQLELLRAVADFSHSRCYSPTIGELATTLGVSRSTTFEHIAELRKKDMLWSQPGRARSLRLTSKAQKLLSGFAASQIGPCLEQQAGIRLAGRVAAGVPIEAIEDKQQLSLNSYFGDSDDTFALEVRGDSMIGDNIHEGDYVICRRSCTADNGQLVIAIVDENEATLKRFYKEKSRVRLQPANDDYQPIYSQACRIEAVVIGLVRKL